MAADGSRIVQRGLLLLIVVGAIAGSVLMVMLSRFEAAPTGAGRVPPSAVAFVCLAQTSFPGNISWPALYRAGEALPSAPGWEIRYTATRVLAKRGSAKVPFSILCEMLDEHRQLRNFQARLADGRIVPDEGAAGEEVVIALKAVGEWHKHQDAVASAAPGELNKLARAVERLTQSSNQVIRTRAHETLLAVRAK